MYELKLEVLVLKAKKLKQVTDLSNTVTFWMKPNVYVK